MSSEPAVSRAAASAAPAISSTGSLTGPESASPANSSGVWSPAGHSYHQRRPKSVSSLSAQGEPMIWLTGGALAVALAMIGGLLSYIVWQGLSTFWPVPVIRVELRDGHVLMGEFVRRETFQTGQGAKAERESLRTGNAELSGTHFTWVDEADIVSAPTQPHWALVVERLEYGRFYGMPLAMIVDGKAVADTPAAAWAKYQDLHSAARQRWRERIGLVREIQLDVAPRMEAAVLSLKEAERNSGRDSDAYQSRAKDLAEIEAWQVAKIAEIERQVAALSDENARYKLRLETAQGQTKDMPLEEIVRAYPANQLGFWSRLGWFADRWREFLFDEPRAANSEGGVFPAIFGTVVMTLVMSVAVVPFGVLAALYLREYAKPGPIVSAVRIAINNLAGVPSIVFGVFGLGFFCYMVGGRIDQLFFSAAVAEHHPTFGAGGLLWASLTLALLTLPVVIVTTEEALAAVPGSMREGSYACGASKWQTIQRIVLPRAAPGIMTGMILAMARGAGEVAPLMLVGAVKMAPQLPVDGVFPFLHAQRSFMHLGYQIFDLGYHGLDSEAAKPMVYTTTLLLIAIVTFLNVTAIWLRGRLRRRFVASHF